MFHVCMIVLYILYILVKAVIIPFFVFLYFLFYCEIVPTCVHILLLCSSLYDFPSLQRFSFPLLHLSFSCLTPPVSDSIISLFVYSLCSPSYLCQFVSSFPVMPPCVSHPCHVQWCLPMVCFCCFVPCCFN